jgi:dsRNA-specific ribonuclease
MVEFRKAFTHASSDPINNYEMYEFLGDTTVNSVIAYYLQQRFPKIVSVKWLTKLKHNLSSGKMLAKIAKQHGLDRYVKYGQEFEEKINKNPDLNTNTDYLAMLEDVLEAFFGCLVTIVEKSGKVFGVGQQIAYTIISSFLNELEISIKYEDVFDAVSRLKELYESKHRGSKWPHSETYEITKLADGKYQVKVFGWPLGDKKYDKEHPEENRVELANVKSLNKDEAKQKASNLALRKLDTVYHITEAIPNPYTQKNV